MYTFSNVMGTETAYQNFILCVQITVSSSAYSSSSSSWLCLFYPFLFFFVVLIDISTSSASVSVCNSETIGDYLARGSKMSVLMVHVALAETLDSLHKLWRELRWRVQRWPLTKLTCRWFLIWYGNFTISCLCLHSKNISVRPPPFPNTTVVCATSYLSTHSYLAYWHNKLYDELWNIFFLDFQKKHNE
jgi:hypothetical protein